MKSAFFIKTNFKHNYNKSLFIGGFKEEASCHKVKSINEKKDRVMVLHIENFTKPLYQVFLKDLTYFFLFLEYMFLTPIADFKLPNSMVFILSNLECQN